MRMDFGMARVGVALVLCVGGCADDGGQVGGDRPARGGAEQVDGPVFAMMTQVYTEDDRDVYFRLTDTLDLKGDIDLDGTREYAGVANVAAVGGRLLVSDGDKPSITSFDIDADLEWHERDKISFAGYPLEDNANLYAHFMLDEHTAYLPFEETQRIIWDPTDFEIREVMEDSRLELKRDGMLLAAGGNRNSVQFDGPVLHGFFYRSEDWSRYGDGSYVAVYDPETHEEIDVIDVPCPCAANATRDEQGRTYFSSWGYMPTLALYGAGPAPCVARITEDQRLDEDFTTDFTDWTGGRYTHNFRYIGGGRAIANVLHHEELDVDFEGEVDPDVEEAVQKSGPHWRLWLFDLERERAQEISGIDVAIDSGAQFAVLEGRTFIFVPYEDWGRTKAFELDEDGRAIERFDSVGDIFKWIQVR